MITKFAMASDIANVLSEFSSRAANPENFLSIKSAESLQFRKCTKTLYDFTKSSETSALAGDALPELIIDQFDDEQVWQEIELQNEPSVSYLLKHIAKVASQSGLTFIPKSRNSSQPAAEEEPLSSKKKKSVKFTTEENKDETENVLSDLSDLETDDKLKDTKSILDDLDSDDESDEEKELKAALERATAAPEGEDDDDNEDDENKDDENSDNDDIKSDSDFDLDISSKKTDKKSTETRTAKKRKTVVDDKFFKMADMETFLDREDAREEKRRKVTKQEESDSDEDSDEEEIDWFAKMSDEENQEQNSDENDSKEQKYGDFFDPPEGEKKQKKKKKPTKEKSVEPMKDVEIEDDKEDGDDQVNDENIDEDSSSDEDIDDVQTAKAVKKSSFEMRQERLKERITDLESKSLGEKPWQLSGEISATARPENSLLQEHLDFEHTTNSAPVITEETTKTLEDLIIQRIKDKAWDDVERKTKQVEQPFEYKKRVVLDQEKSKISLGEVYEQEFLKQTQEEEEEEQTDPQHEGIKKMMQSLFLKLDALSNFHYTPKQAAPEVKIVSNLPSIAMEEVAPVAVADASRLAPEEVLEKSKGELKGASERTSTDKKRARREKKLRQKTRKADKELREKKLSSLNTVLGNKYSKQKALADITKQSLSSKSGVSFMKEDSTKRQGLTSSTKFFTQLQEEVHTGISEKKAAIKQKKDMRKQTSSSKLKL